MITWLDVLDCGCCGIIWSLMPAPDGTTMLLSVLTELEPAEAAEAGVIAVLADRPTSRKMPELPSLDGFNAAGSALRERVVSAWYGSGPVAS